MVLDDADLESEEPVNLAHPFAVALGQIVVDRDDMNALAREGVEIARKRGDQGLALAGAHLGDLALVQEGPAGDLHVEVAHAQNPLARLAHHGKGLGEQRVERGTVGKAFLERRGHAPEVLVRLFLDLGLECVDAHDHGSDLIDLALVGVAENLG